MALRLDLLVERSSVREYRTHEVVYAAATVYFSPIPSVINT